MSNEPKHDGRNDLSRQEKLAYALLIVTVLAALCILALWCEGRLGDLAGQLFESDPWPLVKDAGAVACRLALAMTLGLVIGIERERREKPAGVRTVAMVTVGACLFTLVGASLVSGTNEDALSRVLQGIITGIGFLGAGTIMKHDLHVEGLTTAATLWAVTGVGLACGTGHYFLAIVSTAAIWVVLKLMLRAEARFHRKPNPPAAGAADEG